MQGLAYSVSGGWSTTPADHVGLFTAGGETAKPAEFLVALQKVLQVALAHHTPFTKAFPASRACTRPGTVTCLAGRGCSFLARQLLVRWRRLNVVCAFSRGLQFIVPLNWVVLRLHVLGCVTSAAPQPACRLLVRKHHPAQHWPLPKRRP